MSVINISIIDSEEQIVSGIPRFVNISANIPSAIFYTLDGSDPTINSTIYIDKISLSKLPSNNVEIILKVFATNGIDTSPIITHIYEPILTNDIRYYRGDTNQQPNDVAATNSKFPFGSDYNQSNVIFTGPPGNLGIIVDDPELPQISNGFDGYQNPNNFSNLELNLQNYNIIYSTTNSQGESGKGIGNLPGNVTIEAPIPPPVASDVNDKYFNPKSFIIFQDYANDDPTKPPVINKMYYTNINPETVRDGAYFMNTGLENQTTTGSFLRSHYNPRTKNITYYYFDRISLSWIISTQPYEPTNKNPGNFSGMVNGRDTNTAGFVFNWVLWKRRILF
jgi:hypothetical protein